MKIFSFVLFIVILFSPHGYSQIKRSTHELPISTKHLSEQSSLSFSAGMGIAIISLPDISDYLNIHAGYREFDEFQSAPEFFGSLEILLSPTWGTKIEYMNVFTSYSVLSGGFQLDDVLQLKMPSLLVQKIFQKEFSVIKIGAGIGYHFGSLEETFLGSTIFFRANGIGFKGECEANTALTESLYAYLASDVRINFLGTLRSNNGSTPNIYYSNSLSRAVSLNFFSIGFMLGLILYV